MDPTLVGKKGALLGFRGLQARRALFFHNWYTFELLELLASCRDLRGVPAYLYYTDL